MALVIILYFFNEHFLHFEFFCYLFNMLHVYKDTESTVLTVPWFLIPAALGGLS